MGATGVPCLPSCLEIICPKGDTDLKKNREKSDYFFIGLKLSKAVREPHMYNDKWGCENDKILIFFKFWPKT